RFGVNALLRLSATHQGPRCRIAPTGDLSMARRGGGRRLCRLRAGHEYAFCRGDVPADHETFPRRQSRQNPYRTADQVGAGYQSQDCECDGCDGPRGTIAASGQADRIARHFRIWPEADIRKSRPQCLLPGVERTKTRRPTTSLIDLKPRLLLIE